MRRMLLTLTAAVVVVSLVLGLAGGGMEKLYSQPQQVKIGVVDLRRISEKFQKWVKFSDEVQVMNDEMDAESTKYEQEMANLQEMLKQFKRGSEQWIEAQVKLRTLDVKRAAVLHNKQKEIKAKVERYGRELFEDIEKIIKDYGRQNNFTLIIRDEDLAIRDFNDMQQYISRKDIMWFRPSIDITNEVVKILNKKFK